MSRCNTFHRRTGALGLASILAAWTAGASAAPTIDVFDRTAHRLLPVYERGGRSYVAGEPGHEYELRISNDDGGRTLAVASVDGVNVISGETASPDQSGYVLSPYETLNIAGWRKSLSHTAAFYFTKLDDSYAARTGRPDDVGVIGVAFFRERVRCCTRREEIEEKPPARSQNDAVAPAAPETQASRQKSADSRLGTGHGRSEYNAAEYTDFERVSEQPEQVIAIYYDSRRNLLAQGIIPRPPKLAEQRPRPFPGGFVPDP
jgi:hypothetical protein